MANLTPASAKAIARLRAYHPPSTVYHNLPLTRKAAVLILLFPDRAGELRVVLTMRASTLKTYDVDAASYVKQTQGKLPYQANGDHRTETSPCAMLESALTSTAGKCDDPSETPFQTARREAFEEIGLPLDDVRLPAPFRVEHLCQLPTNLARTELGVRPCVALLSTSAEATSLSTTATTTSVEATLIPRLDAKEVAAVFSAPFRGFLRTTMPSPAPATGEWKSKNWYSGVWTNWHEQRWRMHSFYVPVYGQFVAWPRETGKARTKKEEEGRLEQTGPHDNNEDSADPSTSSSSAVAAPPVAQQGSSATPPREISPPSWNQIDRKERGEEEPSHFRVFGMTARILVDAARIAYDEEPEFEHNSHFGDEEIIMRLLQMGRMSPIRKDGEVLSPELIAAASKI